MKCLLTTVLCLLWAGIARPQIGPFEVSNRDSTAQIQLQFAGQLRTQYESKDNGEGKERSNKLFTEARRIRLTLSGKIPARRLAFKLHLSTAPGSLELMDAFFDYRLRPEIQLRFGQYKTPFTRYRIQSFQRLTFADWAIVTKYFGAERQMGLAVHNGYEKPPRWGYAVGIFTGVNARASHAVGLASIYGEATANPSDLTDPGSRAEYHPEIFIHGSFRTDKIDVQSDTDEKRGPFGALVAFNAAWDFDPVYYQDLYLRFAPEVLVKYRGLSFSGIAYGGMVRMPFSQIVRMGMTGLLAQSAYRINRAFEFSARYAVVDLERKLVDDARDRAEDLISAARSAYESAEEQELLLQDLNNVIARYKNAGQVRREEEVTVGFNIYWAEHALKWQNDAGLLIHARRTETRQDAVIRSQLQLSF